LQHST